MMLASALAGAFREHPAGVAILTVQGLDGPQGLTISSLTSVSVTPPVIAASLANGSSTLAALRIGARVVVHLLDAAQESLADEFARPGGDHFARTPWTASPEGAPLLGTPGPRLHGWVLDRLDVGTSTLVAMQVDDIEPGSRDDDALIRMGRSWRRLPRPSASSRD